MEQRYQTFTGIILNISRCIQKIKNVEMAPLGLKGKQVQCIYTLDQLKDGASLTKLCEVNDEDKGAMSRTVKELIEKKLVRVEENENQKYRNPIKLTEAGKKVAQFITDKINHVLEVVSNGVSSAEREIFYKALKQISMNLDSICLNYGGNK